MSELVVFEDAGWRNLLPLTWWRATFDLRCGRDDLLTKIESTCGATAALAARPMVAAVVAQRRGRPLMQTDAAGPRTLVNGRLLLRESLDLPVGSAAWRGDVLLAARVQANIANRLTADVLRDPAKTRDLLAGARDESLPAESATLIDRPWQLYHENAAELRRQARGRSPGRSGAAVHPGAQLVGDDIHLAAGCVIRPGAVLDAEPGPIFVEAGAVISANASVQGPCSIGPNCLVQPTTVVREATSLGPWCKVGGELEGTIFHGYSNKQHHGFLGHSYVCEWVNLGAGTVNSDLKNTYGKVQVPICGTPIETGQTFVGALIADHAKSGINTVLPTGGVVGFAANLFSSRHAPKFVPSFAWITDEGAEKNDVEKALAVARTMAARRKITFSADEERLFREIAAAARLEEMAG